MLCIKLILFTAFRLSAVQAQPLNLVSPFVIDPVVVEGGSPGSRPATPTLESARRNVSDAVLQVLENIPPFITPAPTTLPPDHPCGGLGWTLAVSLDMGDPSQQCPSPWTEIATPARSCYTPQTSDDCHGLTFDGPGVTYSHVCGRAVGYARGTVDGFLNAYGQNSGTIDEAYLDGVSVTHGMPHQHIWSFGGGYGSPVFRCPCDTSDRNQAPLPPSFVGDNYFCDAEHNGALWDSMGCTSPCCTFNSPPWFSVTLSSPTSDDIEVRICSDEMTGNEAVHIRLLEFYIR